MALVVKDRVQVSSSTTGTGTLTLGVALGGFQDFSVIGDGNTTYYAITNNGEWEVGIGTYTASGNTLSRDTVLESSNSGNKINLSGTSLVFCTYPAKKSVDIDTAQTLTNKTLTSPVLITPALGTPSSGTVTNLTGTASININGTVGATTPATGAFTTLSATGVTTVQSGTAAAPAITTTGDTNTGIFFPAADTIAFAEGGAEAMRIDSSGDVSIGTTAVAGKLTVQGPYSQTGTPGGTNYTIDSSPTASSVANNGTVDFPSASGMLVVNNWTNGGVTIWLCGGGSTSAVASVVGTVGSLAYNAGINGYRWTNNYGSTATFGFFFVRTRTGA